MASLALFQSFENENYIEEQNARPIELYITVEPLIVATLGDPA